MFVRTSLLLTALPLLAGMAAAQERLTITPDTVIFPVENVVWVLNNTEQPISVDSLEVVFSGPRAWYIQFLLSDSVYGEYYFNPFYETTGSVGIQLEPSDSAAVLLGGVDPCVICSADGKTVWYDTLVIHSSSDVPSDTVLVDGSRIVNVDHDLPGAGSASLEVYPNPTTGRITVRLDGLRPTFGQVTVYSLHGQVVRLLQRVQFGANQSLDLGGLPTGAYFVKVELDSRETLTHSLIVTR